jgi:hypothetical protein
MEHVMEPFRYRKASRTRTYNLRVLSEDKVELWVVAEERGTILDSRKLVTFDDPGEVEPFLQEIERELRQGGWCQVPCHSRSPHPEEV